MQSVPSLRWWDGPGLSEVSQLAALRGGPGPARREVFYGVTDRNIGVHGPALRVGRWKLIEESGGAPGRRRCLRAIAKASEKVSVFRC